MGILQDIADFVLPRQCHLCGHRLSAKERHICAACIGGLPRTDFLRYRHNPVEQEFWGQIPVERIASFLHYDSSRARDLIHTMKYRHDPEAGMFVAEVFAAEMKGTGFFNDIDGIVAVPLSRQRQWKRGYNQSEWIARGISRQTGIPFLKSTVKRVVDNPTQTNLQSHERWENVQDIFRLAHPEHVHGKHILLVDDVMTTGATIKSCARELAKAGDIRLSVITLCIAGHHGYAASEEDEAGIGSHHATGRISLTEFTTMT